jgi:hypothetical protein
MTKDRGVGAPETPDLQALMRKQTTDQSAVKDAEDAARADRYAVNVEYEARHGGMTLRGLFEFRALSVADLHVVGMNRAGLAGGNEWALLTPGEREMIQALATLDRALTKSPAWYDPKGQSMLLGRDLYAGLYEAYTAWDAGLFRVVEAPGAGAEKRPALVIAPALGEVHGTAG